MRFLPRSASNSFALPVWSLKKEKKIFNNTEINTKLLRFRINNLHNIKLSQNAKLILESVYLPCIFDNNLDIKKYKHK